MRINYWIVSVLTLLLLSGCSPFKQYSATDIREEYSDSGALLTRFESRSKTFGDEETRLPAKAKTDLNDPLTITQVIDITVSKNPNLQQAIHRIAQAKAMKDLADAAFWPVLGVYTEYTQGDAPSAYLFKTIDQRKLPPNSNFNDPGWFENYESGISARMNLFNGGRDFLGLSMSEQAVDISDLDRQSVENDLKARVISAFYDTLAAREFVEIAEESVASVSGQLRIIQVQYAGGGALKSDVLSLEVRLAQAKESLVMSRNSFKLLMASLANLMGIDPVELSQETGLLAKPGDMFINVPETYEEGLIYALSHRPELEKIRKQLIKTRMGVDAAKTGYLPRVDLMGKYYVDDPSMEYDRNRENWTAAVMFNWELFTGLSTKAGIRKADAVVRETLAADRQVTLGVKLDVKTSYLNLEAAEARYEVAASSVESAAESYRLVKEHYKGGMVTITRYLEAELDLNRSRIRSTAAYYDKIKAVAECARAIGKWVGQNQ